MAANPAKEARVIAAQKKVNAIWDTEVAHFRKLSDAHDDKSMKATSDGTSKLERQKSDAALAVADYCRGRKG